MEKTLLLDNKWLKVYNLVIPEKNVPGYVFSHEASCDGKKIAILPYRYKDNGECEVLLRKEYTPCWDTKNLIISSITGGVIDNNPIQTCIEELLEEAGYQVPASIIEPLGTCFGVKSADTVYYLFTVDLTNIKQGKPTTTDLQEQVSHCYWTDNLDDIKQAGDPLVPVLYLRMEVDVQH